MAGDPGLMASRERSGGTSFGMNEPTERMQAWRWALGEGHGHNYLIVWASVTARATCK